MNTARIPASLELASYEKRLIQSLREVRQGTTKPCRDTYVSNLVADLISKGRLACIRQLLAILNDAKVRGASKADALAFADEWKAVTESMYGVEHVDFDAANMGEEMAEAPHEVAQMRLIQERSGPAARAFLSARRAYLVADEKLAQCAHRILSGHPA